MLPNSLLFFPISIRFRHLLSTRTNYCTISACGSWVGVSKLKEEICEWVIVVNCWREEVTWTTDTGRREADNWPPTGGITPTDMRTLLRPRPVLIASSILHLSSTHYLLFLLESRSITIEFLILSTCLRSSVHKKSFQRMASVLEDLLTEYLIKKKVAERPLIFSKLRGHFRY